jgi:hypothetical protein
MIYIIIKSEFFRHPGKKPTSDTEEKIQASS